MDYIKDKIEKVYFNVNKATLIFRIIKPVAQCIWVSHWRS
jgi:hypothetical protein